MINLAGIPRDRANEQVCNELHSASINHYEILTKEKREVVASIVGVILSQECFFGFQRAWYYWVVKATKPFPLKEILTFNEQWGNEARIWGFAGGRTNREIEKDHLEGHFGCLESWHIDTQAALDAFVIFIKKVYGGEDKYSNQILSSLINGNNLFNGTLVVFPNSPTGDSLKK